MTTGTLRIATAVAVSSAAVAAVTALGAGPAAAAGATGCPAGYEVLSVDALSAQGYLVPALVDDPTSGVRSFGLPGNGNGQVCAVRLGTQTFGDGLQIYNFLDDNLRS